MENRQTTVKAVEMEIMALSVAQCTKEIWNHLSESAKVHDKAAQILAEVALCWARLRLPIRCFLIFQGLQGPTQNKKFHNNS